MAIASAPGRASRHCSIGPREMAAQDAVLARVRVEEHGQDRRAQRAVDRCRDQRRGQRGDEPREQLDRVVDAELAVRGLVHAPDAIRSSRAACGAPDARCAASARAHGAFPRQSDARRRKRRAGSRLPGVARRGQCPRHRRASACSRGVSTARRACGPAASAARDWRYASVAVRGAVRLAGSRGRAMCGRWGSVMGSAARTSAASAARLTDHRPCQQQRHEAQEHEHAHAHEHEQHPRQVGWRPGRLVEQGRQVGRQWRGHEDARQRAAVARPEQTRDQIEQPEDGDAHQVEDVRSAPAPTAPARRPRPTRRARPARRTGGCR